MCFVASLIFLCWRRKYTPEEWQSKAPPPTTRQNDRPSRKPTSQSINQSINQASKQPINQSINWFIHQPTNGYSQSTNRSTNPSLGQSINQSIDQAINQSINHPDQPNTQPGKAAKREPPCRVHEQSYYKRQRKCDKFNQENEKSKRFKTPSIQNIAKKRRPVRSLVKYRATPPIGSCRSAATRVQHPANPFVGTAQREKTSKKVTWLQSQSTTRRGLECWGRRRVRVRGAVRRSHAARWHSFGCTLFQEAW